jgi:release factor glutamine methyltransferase
VSGASLGHGASPGTTSDAELLLAHVLGVDPAWLVAHDDAEIGEAPARRFAELVERRRRGEPLAYLIGSAGFYRREFMVDERVLVPRPETEHLVEAALEHLRAHARPRVLDVGTGSGAIACTIAAELANAHVDAVDASLDALDVARENCRRLGVQQRVRLVHGDLTQPVSGERYHAIVANLPYVPTAEIARPPDPVSFEPRAALDGGSDGLAIYRRLLPDLPALLEPGGLVLAEAAPPTIQGLASLAREAFPNAAVTIGYDYAGLERFVRVRVGDNACGAR